MLSVKKNNFDFSVPLTKEEIQAAQLGKEKRERFDLGGLLARNQGLIGAHMQGVDETPVINGYKMLKDTPLVTKPGADSKLDALLANRNSALSDKQFKLPFTPTREELGHKIANEA